MNQKQKTNNLLELFDQRHKQYQHTTTQIFKQLNNTIQGIVAYLQDKEEIEKGEFIIEDILLEDDIILFIASIEFSPGTELTNIFGETLKVSEENVEYFVRTIRIGIPVSKIFYTKSQLYSFLQKTDRTNQPDISTDQTLSSPVVQGFDLEELTDEQKQNLLMNINIGKIN